MNLNDATFRVFDTETTGLDPDADMVVEVACVDVFRGRAIWAYESLVNPGRPIPPEASAIHHITDADVLMAPSITETMNSLTNGVCIPVAHNASFDSAMLSQYIEGPWLCTRRLSAHLWPEAPSHSNQVLRYWLELDCPAAKGMPAHRAMSDAYVTGALLVRALAEIQERGIADTVEGLLEYASGPILQTKIKFGKHFGKLWHELPIDYLLWMSRNEWDEETTYTLNNELRRRVGK